jgi:acyl-coenzyme A synthetase/AMP-(fatty) acid ligase
MALLAGDIARVDENGDYYVVDRLSEPIKYVGYPVAPAQPEAVLLAHPDVLDPAVIACPTPPPARRRRPFVVSRRGCDADALMAGWPSEAP